jgi:hypothetical protein
MLLWNATGTWRQIRQLNKPRATPESVVRRPSGPRHPIAAMVSTLLEFKFPSSHYRRAKSRG